MSQNPAFEFSSLLSRQGTGVVPEVPVETSARPTKPLASNRLLAQDQPFHDWYRFVLSFPPHLVRDLLKQIGLGGQDLVLDPFCGTGTTLVECKRQGLSSVGIEANPLAHFASEVKLDWSVDADDLAANSAYVSARALSVLARDGVADDDPKPLFDQHSEGRSVATLRSLSAEREGLLLAGSISPLPLHKALVLAEAINEHGEPRFQAHQKLALAKLLAYSISNLTFGPEVGVGARKLDAPVVTSWMNQMEAMAADLRQSSHFRETSGRAILGDSRVALSHVQPESVGAVITSPPYPNENSSSSC